MIRPIPLMTAQHRPMTLTVEPGLHGGRVTLVGSGSWEVVADFANTGAARAAVFAALMLTDEFWAKRAAKMERPLSRFE